MGKMASNMRSSSMIKKKSKKKKRILGSNCRISRKKCRIKFENPVIGMMGMMGTI
jgi:hypothetical protein